MTNQTTKQQTIVELDSRLVREQQRWRMPRYRCRNMRSLHRRDRRRVIRSGSVILQLI